MKRVTVKEYELLEKAAAIVEEKGWITGYIQSSNGDVCALGALGLAQGFTAEEMMEGELHWSELVENTPAFLAKMTKLWESAEILHASQRLAEEPEVLSSRIAKIKKVGTDPRRIGDVVWMYNDDHCEGGHRLIAILRETAAELRALETR